ncbi:unnamed protein product [Cochlearia groenlandica]
MTERRGCPSAEDARAPREIGSGSEIRFQSKVALIPSAPHVNICLDSPRLKMVRECTAECTPRSLWRPVIVQTVWTPNAKDYFSNGYLLEPSSLFLCPPCNGNKRELVSLALITS